jgi:hypothetical protein
MARVLAQWCVTLSKSKKSFDPFDALDSNRVGVIDFDDGALRVHVERLIAEIARCRVLPRIHAPTT